MTSFRHTDRAGRCTPASLASPAAPDAATPAAPGPDARRRRLLALGALATAGAALAPHRARAQSRQPVTVVTAYPEEVSSRIEAAFEAAHPAYRLQLVWRMPHDALPYLQAPRQSGADVVWLASPRTFASLQKSGALRPLGISLDGLPARVGGTPLTDPAGCYTASEVAGYGFVWSLARLAALGLTPPQDWADLAAPGWAGQIALPIPARVGFAPPMLDIVLQADGWERGWAVWSEIAGNAALLGQGSTFITDEVGSGRRALGLSIDFFANAAIAGGAPLRFSYPRHGGLNPAHIGITASAPNPDGARAFVQFVLSEAGQRLLAHPSIRKLPIRPSVYAQLPAGQFNPFEAARQGGYGYDHGASQPRLGLLAALFEQVLVAEHPRRAALWRALHAQEAAGHPNPQARDALTQVPLDAAQAGDAALQARFSRIETAAGVATPPAKALEQAWREQASAWADQAERALAATTPPSPAT